MFLNFLLTLCLAFFVTASPLPGATNAPAEAAGENRRGIAYNNPKVVKQFYTTSSRVTWCYNWDSRTGATYAPFEFVPMLHSNREDHTSRWWDGVKRAANEILEMPTHLLAFNEPDNCMYVASPFPSPLL